METDPGRRASAMSDVAARAGVSHQTVSRVVNGHPHVSAQTRERVQRAIAELGYRPNTAARALATGATRTIGLVTHNVNQYGPAQTMLGLERAARAADYSLAIVVLDEMTTAAMQEAVERLVAQSVDAVVALATYADALQAVRALSAPVPVVTVQAAADPTLPTVWVDQAAGARLATRHLLDLGHETVHHVTGLPGSVEAAERQSGWRAELAGAGAVVPAALPGDWTPSSGYAAGRRLAARLRDGGGGPRPTAVFAGNDQMALGVLKALHDEGLSVPGDVSVVGFDDLPESGYLWPALSTVRQDFAELGRRGLQLLLARLAGEHATPLGAVPAVLVVRDSTAAPAQPA